MAAGKGLCAPTVDTANPQKRKECRGVDLYGPAVEGVELAARGDSPPVLGLGWTHGRFRYVDMVMQPLYIPLVRKFKKRLVASTPPVQPPPVDWVGLDGAIDQEVSLPALMAPALLPGEFATCGGVDDVRERLPPREAKRVVPRVRGTKKATATERRAKSKARSGSADQMVFCAI